MSLLAGAPAAGLVMDFSLVLLGALLIGRGEWTALAVVLGAIRVGIAVDGQNGDGIRSVLAHIYAAYARDREAGDR